MTLWRPDPALIRRPAYLSLADQFARAIGDGLLAGGARLPTHRRLADEMGLSVQTVSRAYEELIRRGLIAEAGVRPPAPGMPEALRAQVERHVDVVVSGGI